MKDLVKMMPAIAILFAIGWCVAFQFNPYAWCEDHPTKPDTYLCEPFGFDLAKGTWLDRRPGDEFAGEDQKLYHKKGGKPPKKTYNCQDDNVLLTQDGYDYCVNGKR